MKHPWNTLALRTIVCACTALSALGAHAACPSWPTAQRFVINGEEVTDLRTGLIWKRCTEGLTLNGNSCEGTASSFTRIHEGALTMAQAANPTSSATGWRLPSVKELASLVDKGCQNPAIDTTAFPNTAIQLYWSASPYAEGLNGSAWIVSFGRGFARPSLRSSQYNARLVRSGS